MGHEREQMRAVGGHALAAACVWFAYGNRRHDAIEPTIESPRYCLRVVSFGVSRRRPIATARNSSRRNGTRLNAVSPHSTAYFASRSKNAPGTLATGLARRWLPSMSDTRTRPDRAEQRPHHGLAAMGLNDVQRGQRMTNTHSHQFLPFNRTDVSSEQITGLASTTASIAAVASSSGSRARARMLLIAPSLMESENSSSSNVTSRSMLMAWA